ncbi:4-hydroxy-3-methylbut-2-enyl diphosphate reductase [Advenella sp. FME57]|uniref:4-hydroxy-3-methylbut-2-enyl diphosphate reductase n=1 Tax=Advenella sp. FME57 TaxID=2742604 RepID=UPI001866781F|nr:4-hydroxy-3-methylbut-2-enyl diphosphate reductase [Advenella sp. FME57]
MAQNSEVILAEPRGFCAGVDRAIDIVERALELHGAPIYVRHEIVHNKFVVESLRNKGAIFIDELDQAPAGAIVVFSAHGVSRAVRAEAQLRDLRIFDATCPLVTKVHIEVAKMHAAGLEIVMIGHKGHPEVEGTLGQAVGRMHLVETPEDVAALQVDNPENTAFVTQTTLSIDDARRVADALRAKFPGIVEPKKSDICYATQNRQDAVKVLASDCDVFFVVGSINSSNSNRLREVAERLDCQAYLIDNALAIRPEWVQGARKIGITAGASAPEVLVQEVVERLKELGAISVRRMDGIKENVTFPLPKELSRKQQAGR